ncbi:AraC-like ligand binding domain-containing protein [Paenibacillus sp. 1_12]|uniref:AraC family transcriptional regulator n=1 Tax=Paenibacillus sp. 1_12 TaxID=1566278 RepID=UPI0008F2401A|nr:AraC family transcriptional regulator [Paenibacillus sp. 1_12]SFL75724.1 AraC-like ligand binding domain-containing protein [Paenibacillus sp. 1_12]
MNRDTLKENRIHGHPKYPVSVYKLHYEAGEPILDCHWHEELEFLIVTSGKAYFQVGAEMMEVSAGQALFIQSGEIHAGYPIEGNACSFDAFVFHSDFVTSSTYDSVQEKFIAPLLRRQYALPIHLKGELDWEKTVLALLLEMIRSNVESAPLHELTTKAQLYLIVAELFSHAAERSPYTEAYTHREKTERLKSVLHYIHEHYQEPIRLKELAVQANMSEGHFCRFFREMMRTSPIDYVNRFRTRQAAMKLEQSDHQIAAIALDTGFDNISYFVRVFKQHTGYTPSHYRKKRQIQL